MPITLEEFNEAVRVCGFPTPDPEVYKHLVASTNDFTREEFAMFLAQLIYESSGFQYREDQEYLKNPNPEEYIDNDGLKDKDYHGRGYLKLTFGSNYKAASAELGLGDRLLREPELVAESTELGVQASAWYWRAVVRPEMGELGNSFGSTTRAINGAIECSGGFNQLAYDRWQTYLKVADALQIKNKADEGGCYN